MDYKDFDQQADSQEDFAFRGVVSNQFLADRQSKQIVKPDLIEKDREL